MAEVSTVSFAAFKNYHQGTQVISPADERHKQRDEREQRQRDHRFQIPDDEQAFHIDEYV